MVVAGLRRTDENLVGKTSLDLCWYLNYYRPEVEFMSNEIFEVHNDVLCLNNGKRIRIKIHYGWMVIIHQRNRWIGLKVGWLVSLAYPLPLPTVIKYTEFDCFTWLKGIWSLDIPMSSYFGTFYVIYICLRKGTFLCRMMMKYTRKLK